MTRNERDRHTAFQAAEAALREGERYVESKATSAQAFASYFDPAEPDPQNCKDGLCIRRENPNSFLYSSTHPSPAGNMTVWDKDQSPLRFKYHTNTNLINSKGISTAPKYIIEFLGYQNDHGIPDLCSPLGTGHACAELYRVTAYATGGTDDAKVMLQSLYQVSF